MPAEVGIECGPWADKLPEKGMTSGIGLLARLGYVEITSWFKTSITSKEPAEGF